MQFMCHTGADATFLVLGQVGGVIILKTSVSLRAIISDRAQAVPFFCGPIIDLNQGTGPTSDLAGSIPLDRRAARTHTAARTHAHVAS